MSARGGLGRHLVLSMAMVAAAMLFLTVAGFYVVYETILYLNPAAVPEEAQAFSGVDGLTLVGVCLLGLAFAAFSAVRLARRILQPLHAVATAARTIASGDLGARARRDAQEIGETGMLVDDFNAMASRLERMANDVVVWNATIAHELRTPLTILRGRLQGISDGVFAPDDTTIRRLLVQVDALSRLVEDLRVVSLVDSGQMPLDLVDIDMAAEIRDVVATMQPELAAAGFTLALDLAPGVAPIDRARLRQAVLALLDNARRHADPCALRVTVSFSPDMLDLCVIDQGPGLPEAFIRQAFDPFARAPRSDAKRGSGLGLSVVRAIARAHGGEASYRKSGTNCTFVLSLPRRRSNH